VRRDPCRDQNPRPIKKALPPGAAAGNQLFPLLGPGVWTDYAARFHGVVEAVMGLGANTQLWS